MCFARPDDTPDLPFTLADGVIGNSTRRVTAAGKPAVLKRYGAKRPRHVYALRLALHKLGLRQPVEYRSPQERRDFERNVLEHWRSNGFRVPEIIVLPCDHGEGPVLVTAWISGPTLSQVLQSAATRAPAVPLLEAVFGEMNGRHARALSQGDPLLCHPDANLRNIIAAREGIYHVDFEMGRPWEAVEAWACREVCKLLICVCEAVGEADRRPLLALFRKEYRVEPVMRAIRKSVTERPFQGLHRWNNRRKKEKDPRRMGLYDLLDALGDA
jgi:tRNA A-37 threonylcarbamoyl transferase component Bud32